MRMLCSRTAVVLLFSIFLKFSFAEGTKQAMPSSSYGVGIYINKNGLSGPYRDADASNRIKLTIKDNTTEYIYIGVQAHDRYTYAEVPVYCKITSPVGNSAIYQITTTASSTGHIDNYTQAVSGPKIGTNSSGYTPRRVTLASTGDYYVEFYTSDDAGATANTEETVLAYFDVTVNTSTTSYNPVLGRVHCQAWSFVTYDPSTFAIGLMPFTESGSSTKFYGLTADSTVASATFNDGFQPLAFVLYFNKYGVTNTGNFPADRKSTTSVGVAPSLPGYEVFFNEPQADVYPRSAVPSAPSVIKIYGCTGNYYVSYKTTAAGDVAVLLDLNGTTGYQPGTSDRYLFAYDVPAGINTIAWDGKNGLGNTVSSSASVKTTLYLRRGRTNLPIYDAELNTKGLTVAGVSPVVYRPKLYWDDASLTNTGGTTASDNTTGPGMNNSIYGQYANPGRAWNGPGADTTVPAAANGGGTSTTTNADDYGNVRVLNTWFWTNEVASSESTYALAGCDRDGDGISDINDLDDDNDGIPDTVEDGVNPTADADSDGIPNYLDRDYGTLNDYGVVASMDTDNDGIINSYDLDSDNDGIPDLVEAGGVDNNGDGTVDYTGTWASVDSDSDGLFDRYDATVTNGVAIRNLDTDSDGIPNFKDLDSDNDGIPDVVEVGGVDANGDGILDNFTDTDNDGFADTVDGLVGTTANAAKALVITGTYNSTTSPIPVNYIQGLANTDGRGLPNPYDLDSDDDGIADITEAGGADTNYDGKIDGFTDTDNDGFSDNVDGDVGNDGNAENTNGPILKTGTDANSDGRADSYLIADNADGTGPANPYDLDSDDDGIPDLIEAGGVDSTGDGRTDSGTDALGNGWTDAYDPTVSGGINIRLLDANGTTAGGGVFDFDGDGIANYLDMDSDNDGIPDIIEQGGTDANNNGKVDTYADIDNDGFADIYDPRNNTTGATTTTLGTALITTATATVANNNLPTVYSAGANFDGTGLINMLDLDDDNDGILNTRESGIGAGTGASYDTNNDGVINSGDTGFADANGDGWADAIDALTAFILRNTDGAGKPNYMDIDSDDDGIVDNIENQLTASYILPAGSDADFDGIDDAYDNNDGLFGGTANNGLTLIDTDGDGISDYRDLDSDNDGYPDFVEGHDFAGDNKPHANSNTKNGVPGGTTDADGDGLLDGYDNNTASLDPTNKAGTTTVSPNNYPNIDNPATAERDWREVFNTDKDVIASNSTDIDDDNDGITDVNESGGYDPLGDADSDGIPNYLDPTPGTGLPTFVDANGDGINDAYDADLDGIINSLDLDSDNDGIPDLVEAGGTDTNGDGVVDVINDTNNNGLADKYDAAVAGGIALANLDTDGDGIPNSRDLDSDNDGIPDITEARGVDANYDGVVDAGYADMDGDGFADAVDGDAGNDGVAENTANALIPTGADANNDGKPDTYPKANADGSTFANPYDLDSDDDGIPDLIEAGGIDTNGDGRIDGTTDANGNGWRDAYDGALTTTGIKLVTLDANGATAGGSVFDFDGDGYPNYLDLDSDNDGIPDIIEQGGIDNGGGALTNDGKVDATTDVDGDGFIDTYDPINNNTSVTLGTAMITASGPLTANNIPAVYSTGDNFDGTGLINMLDLDADGDGILDVRESGLTESATEGIAAGTTGTDGWSTTVNALATLGLTNTDSRGGANYLDIDSDDDGITDNVEGQTTAAYVLPLATDADVDGIDDAYDNVTTAFAGNGSKDITPVNTDGTDVADYRDLDTDNDGITDLKEGYGDPSYVLPNTNDTDGDGLLDAFDSFNMLSLTSAMQAALQSNVTMKYMGANGVYNANPTLYGSSDPIAKSSTISTADRDWRNAAIILPVKLISFTVAYSNKVSSISWVTTNETAHERYGVERSIDGINFTDITSVAARGNGGNYAYTDNTVPTVNIVYYRLKMTDESGNVAYSKVVAIKLNVNELKLSVYPNPVVNVATLSFASTTIQQVTIKVYNMQGTQVMTQAYKAQAGTNTLQLTDWNNLPAGDYLIELGNETFKLTRKLSHVH